ncbi:dsRBD fold-containing protein [Cellulomonas sp. P5_C6]
MTETWNVAIYLDAVDDPTARAHAVLTSSTGATLDGYGRGRFSAYDHDAPAVGTEIAAARALRHLADRLLQAYPEELESSDLSLVP